ncbi:YceI family protein [Winogradskyella immobilis]|uniref:YceI family protein n=1 Tax=Winogradskyella immobilis TaxID=2816852 RepID=A0ABS8EJY6_9FLAO|nr:YceI family protein [Winogradskyella immobilis]MCC1483511.1 YceI family protein [Winogradskyella immobilis]MCG0015605.1 YceI family protein [Winogradskyella immobilis]
MLKTLLSFFIFISLGCVVIEAQDYIDRQGEITFFSYTSVEDIQAKNNQGLSSISLETGDIAVRILMKAFVFKKSLMHEHFNESYIESDLYPEATFLGKIIDFNQDDDEQIRIIKGDFQLRDVSKPFEIKSKITKENNTYSIEGELEVNIEDYKIKVPKLLSPNIAKTIKVSFKFQYRPNEK